MIELINGKHAVEEADAFIFDVDFSAKDTAKKRCRFKLTIEPLGRSYTQDSTGGIIAPTLPESTLDELIDR